MLRTTTRSHFLALAAVLLTACGSSSSAGDTGPSAGDGGMRAESSVSGDASEQADGSSGGDDANVGGREGGAAIDGALVDATTSDDGSVAASEGGAVVSDGAVADGPVIRGNMVLCGGHACQCSNGLDDDADGLADALDPECVSPFDDDESSFATGIPGDNNGANAMTECFFDGNSGPGNDRDCVVPNGCDCRGCCDFDVNRNGTRERVNIREEGCRVTPATSTPNVAGGPCTPSGDGGAGSCMGAGLRCLRDGDGRGYFCSTCGACIFASDETPPLRNCETNPCAAGERCVGDPPPTPVPAPDAGTPMSDAAAPRDAAPAVDGAASMPDSSVPLPVCNGGLTPCLTHPDCAVRGPSYFCITGCCQFLG